jgi:hypothetical protein
MLNKREYLQSGMEMFHIPDGQDTYTELLVPFTVYTDGSITVPNDLNQQQATAFTEYITWNNKHMRTRRGNSLSMMDEEQQILLYNFIELMKSPSQKFYESLHKYVLDSCKEWLDDNQYAHITYSDTMYTEWQQSYIDDGIIPANGCTIFEVTVGAQYGYDNTRFRYHFITLMVHHHVACYHNTKTFELLQSRCDIIENRDYVETVEK